MTDAIALDQLSRRINSDVLALANATCTIPDGDFVAIVGPSGSGKTTLLSLLGLLDRPTSGSYLLYGDDVSHLTERERNHVRGHQLGFVFQNSYLVGAETAVANVTLGLRVRGVPRRLQHSLVLDALDKVGLADSAHKPAGQLSGGEKQRVAVARALVTEPKLLLADEPTGALDSESTANLLSLLHEINIDGTTVVIVTHDPLVAAAARHSFVLTDGVLLDEVHHVG
ncbi:MAG: ABC transporter ATP-binding protein [Propionibacteriaceae bacterium]